MTSFPAWLFAAIPTGDLSYTPPGPPTAPDPFGLVVRLVAMTAVLLALCGAVWWAARRANRPALAAGAGTPGLIRLDGSLALDRRCAVHTLRVDGHAVAVTTDATGLRSIVVLSEPFADALAAADPSA